MANIPFPDLPNVPGVSDIPVNIGGYLPSAAGINASNIISAIRGGSILNAINTLSGEKYGVYQNGKPTLEVDTVLDVDISGQCNISDYPVEQGAFYSYNKVSLPNSYSLTMLKTSPLIGATKTEVIDTLNYLLRPPKFEVSPETKLDVDAANKIEYIDIVTPYKTYINAQLERYSVTENTTEGKVLVIKVIAREIMQPLNEDGDTPAEDSGSSLKNIGKVISKGIKDVSDYISSSAKSALESIKGLI